MSEKEIFVGHQDKLLKEITDYNLYVDSLEGQRNNLLGAISDKDKRIARLRGALEDIIARLNYRCTTGDDLGDESPCNKTIKIAEQALKESE